MPPKAWKTLSSRPVYQNPWTSVREDLVEMPNGKTTIYGVVECKDCVGVLPFLDDMHVVMVRQYRYVFGEISVGRCQPEELSPAKDCWMRLSANYAKRWAMKQVYWIISAAIIQVNQSCTKLPTFILDEGSPKYKPDRMKPNFWRSTFSPLKRSSKWCWNVKSGIV